MSHTPGTVPITMTAIALVFGLSLSSCNRTDTNTTTPVASESVTETVTLLGSLTGVGQEIVEAALVPFVEETGIDVIYEGTDAFTTVLPIRISGGNKPDIALFPQPGLLAELAQEGELVPLNSVIEPQALATAYSEDWLDLGQVDGQLYGLWMRADVKSLAWYQPDAFAAAGYTVPATWAELEALTERMIAAGNVPWCLGMASGDATGWVGTDWIEDILLRTADLTVYDRWITNEIPFSDPRIAQAFEQFGAIAQNPEAVVGGPTGAVSIFFGDSPAALFTDPPGCYLHRQANFIVDFLPDAVVLGEDVQIFPLPPIDPEFENPLLVGGIAFGLLNDTPAARAAMEYLATAVPHEIWAANGYISPHQEVNLEVYPSDIQRQAATLLQQAGAIRFDASDLMPAAVRRTFWQEMINYVSGDPLPDVLQRLDASWDQPQE